RYESASAFAADVQRYLNDEPVLACPPSAWYRFRKFARRDKTALSMAVVVAVALVTALTALAVSDFRVRIEQEAKLQALNDKLDVEKGWADKEAERRRALERWRQTAYYLQVRIAFSEYGANHVARAEEILGACERDLRNWEWHYLKRLCHCELATL